MKRTSLAVVLSLVAAAAGNAQAQTLNMEGSDTVEHIIPRIVAFCGGGEDPDNAGVIDPLGVGDTYDLEGDNDLQIEYIGGGSGTAESAMERHTGERTWVQGDVHSRAQIGPMSRALDTGPAANPDACIQDPVVGTVPPPGGFLPVQDANGNFLQDQIVIGYDAIVSMGGDCVADADCAAGLSCHNNICTPETGDFACNSDADCAAVDWYGQTDENLVCVNNVCEVAGCALDGVGGFHDQGDGSPDDFGAALRLLYFGIEDAGYAAPPANGDNVVANCGGAARQALVNDCNIYHVYRRDDASGTTLDFKRLLGVPGNQPFCNAPNREWIGDVTSFNDKTDEDPIRVNCDHNEDVCSPDGTLGVVLPILPPTETDDLNILYPRQTCANVARWTPNTENAANTSWGEWCSPGHEIIVGGCIHATDGNGNSNCMYYNEDQNSLFLAQLFRLGDLGNPAAPDADAENDARSYNLDVRTSDGHIVGTHRGHAFFRVHSFSQFDYDFAGGELMLPNPNNFGDAQDFAWQTIECQELTATDQVGCLTGRDARWGMRSLGFAGIGALEVANAGAGHEVAGAVIGSGPYPLNRRLHINVMTGIETVVDNLYSGNPTDGYNMTDLGAGADGADEASVLACVMAEADLVSEAVNRSGFIVSDIGAFVQGSANDPIPGSAVCGP